MEAVFIGSGDPLLIVVPETGSRKSEQFKFRRRSAAITARLKIERDFLVVVQAFEAGTLNCRDMYEYILAAIVGRNETLSYAEKSLAPFD